MEQYNNCSEEESDHLNESFLLKRIHCTVTLTSLEAFQNTKVLKLSHAVTQSATLNSFFSSSF